MTLMVLTCCDCASIKHLSFDAAGELVVKVQLAVKFIGDGFSDALDNGLWDELPVHDQPM